jgi:hypothetical protein
MATPPSRPALIEYDHPASPQIGRWIRQNVIPYDDKQGRCYKLVVKHFSINKKPQGDVCKIQVPENVSAEGGVDALISEVIRSAQDDSNNLHSGVQLYAVFAYYSSAPDYVPRCFFRVAAEEEYDPETTASDPTEPATPQGMLGQAMRHIEAIMKTSVIQTSHVIQVLQQENASQRELLAKQSEQAIDAMAMIQETLDNATQRGIDVKNAQMKQDVIAGVFEHLKLIIPVALNRLAGQKIAPETDASFMQLAALFEGMPKEQQEEFATRFLNPAQAAVFAEFIDTYEKRKGQLTSKDGPGPRLNLPALFDDRKERMAAVEDPVDARLARMEKKAKTFKDVFSNPHPFTGPLKPSLR